MWGYSLLEMLIKCVCGALPLVAVELVQSWPSLTWPDIHRPPSDVRPRNTHQPQMYGLYAAKHDGSLSLQLGRIPVPVCLLGIFKPSTCMTLQHAVFPTEAFLAEATITHDRLCSCLARRM